MVPSSTASGRVSIALAFSASRGVPVPRCAENEDIIQNLHGRRATSAAAGGQSRRNENGKYRRLGDIEIISRRRRAEKSAGIARATEIEILRHEPAILVNGISTRRVTRRERYLSPARKSAAKLTFERSSKQCVNRKQKAIEQSGEAGEHEAPQATEAAASEIDW